MILKKIRIKNYKSIYDSGQIEVGPFNCFIGKNNSGKSAFLEAIYKINPFFSSQNIPYDILDAPRNKIDFVNESTNIVEADFELSNDEAEIIYQKFGNHCLKSKLIKITKNYSNQFTWNFEVDENVYINHIIFKRQIPDEFSKLFKDVISIDEALTKARNLVNPPKAVTSFINQLEILQLRSMKEEIIDGYLSSFLPKIYYLKNIPDFNNNLSLKYINKDLYSDINKESINPSTAFCKLIDADIDELIFDGNSKEVQLKLEQMASQVNNDLLHLFPDYKSYKIRFDNKSIIVDNNIVDSMFKIFIVDTLSNIEIPIEKFSSSFIYILSFMSTVQYLKFKNKNTIILAENPACILHPENQKIFKESLKAKTTEQFQIFYTTQSPFMLDNDDSNNICAVFNSSKNGTTVTQSLDLEKDDGTLKLLKLAELFK